MLMICCWEAGAVFITIYDYCYGALCYPVELGKLVFAVTVTVAGAIVGMVVKD